MIKVIGKLDCTSVEAEFDPYVPLTVTWDTSSGQQPLYWRISGNAGGELEIKIDPVRGAVRELIVIDEPPARAGDMAPGIPSEPGIPVFDRSPWRISVNPDYSEFASRVVTSTEAVAISKNQSSWCVLFSAQQTSRVFECGSAEIHLADDGTLTAVVVHF